MSDSGYALTKESSTFEIPFSDIPPVVSYALTAYIMVQEDSFVQARKGIYFIVVNRFSECNNKKK